MFDAVTLDDILFIMTCLGADWSSADTTNGVELLLLDAFDSPFEEDDFLEEVDFFRLVSVSDDPTDETSDVELPLRNLRRFDDEGLPEL